MHRAPISGHGRGPVPHQRKSAGVAITVWLHPKGVFLCPSSSPQKRIRQISDTSIHLAVLQKVPLFLTVVNRVPCTVTGKMVVESILEVCTDFCLNQRAVIWAGFF